MAEEAPNDPNDPYAQQGKPEASKFRTIQPERWSDDMACTINVGLGTGSRDRDMSMLNVILNGQIGMADRLGAAGLKAKAIEFLPKIRKTAVQLAESSGLKNPAEYYPEITEEELEQFKQQASQPQPDPAVQLEEMKGQVTLKVEEGKNQIALQTKQMDSEVQVRREQAQLEADLQTKEADRQNALVIEQQHQAFEREKIQADYNFRSFELQTNVDLEREKMANAVKVAAAKPKPQPGKGATT
jgi:hypothetical protein